jgi:hypothetical protein
LSHLAHDSHHFLQAAPLPVYLINPALQAPHARCDCNLPPFPHAQQQGQGLSAAISMKKRGKIA